MIGIIQLLIFWVNKKKQIFSHEEALSNAWFYTQKAKNRGGGDKIEIETETERQRDIERDKERENANF